MTDYTLRLSPNFAVSLFHGYPILRPAGFEKLFMRMEDLRSLTAVLRSSLRRESETPDESNRDFIVYSSADSLVVARNDSTRAPTYFSLERWELAALVCGLEAVLEDHEDRHRWHCRGFLTVTGDGPTGRRGRPAAIPFLAA